jgi:hypothetical protein
MYRDRDSETERTENNVQMLVSFGLRFSYSKKCLRSNKPEAAGSVDSASNIDECSAMDCNGEYGSSHVINSEVPNGGRSCFIGA